MLKCIPCLNSMKCMKRKAIIETRGSCISKYRCVQNRLRVYTALTGWWYLFLGKRHRWLLMPQLQQQVWLLPSNSSGASRDLVACFNITNTTTLLSHRIHWIFSRVAAVLRRNHQQISSHPGMGLTHRLDPWRTFGTGSQPKTKTQNWSELKVIGRRWTS